jgi:hypothetical protein
VEEAIKGANRHIKEVEFDSHGYSVVDLTRQRIQFDTYFISSREDPAATQAFYRGFTSEIGSRTVNRAAAAVSTDAAAAPVPAPSWSASPQQSRPVAAATTLPSTGGSTVIPASAAVTALGATILRLRDRGGRSSSS